MMRRFKKYSKDATEPYEDWKERNQARLTEKTAQEPKRIWYKCPWIIGACSLCLVLAIVLPILLPHLLNRNPSENPLIYGEKDIKLEFSTEKLFTEVSGLHIENLEQAVYREGIIFSTGERAYVSLTGVQETDDFYAELKIIAITMPNVRLENAEQYETLEQPCEIGQHDVRYQMITQDEVYTTYLAYAESDDLREYIEVKTLWEIDFESFLREFIA